MVKQQKIAGGGFRTKKSAQRFYGKGAPLVKATVGGWTYDRRRKRKLTPLQDLRMRVSIAKKAGFFKQPRIKKQLAALKKADRER